MQKSENLINLQYFCVASKIQKWTLPWTQSGPYGAGELPAAPSLLSTMLWGDCSPVTPLIAGAQGAGRSNREPALEGDVILLNTVCLGRELRLLL